jgi:hypothetical protein
MLEAVYYYTTGETTAQDNGEDTSQTVLDLALLSYGGLTAISLSHGMSDAVSGGHPEFSALVRLKMRSLSQGRRLTLDSDTIMHLYLSMTQAKRRALTASSQLIKRSNVSPLF